MASASAAPLMPASPGQAYRSGSRCLQTGFAIGQRAEYTQPSSGSPRAGSVPGMVCSAASVLFMPKRGTQRIRPIV